MATRTVVVLEGDQTGQELLEEVLRVLQPDVIGFPIDFQRFNLRLEHRRQTKNKVVEEGAAAMRACGLGLKAATITPEEPGDVGSPNAILREAIGATVILRVGRRLPGVRVVGGVFEPVAVVRMAVGDAYRAKEWREGEPGSLEEVALRADRITRAVCRSVAEFSFRYAERNRARVLGGPKFTVSPTYEGMFKEELDAAADRHPGVKYDPVLIDALYALLLNQSGEAAVIPALNRDGDCLSDLVMQMFGSIAGAESMIFSFKDDWTVAVAMAEAPHGTAPRLEGKNVANPLAMILAGAALLGHFGEPAADRAAEAIRSAALGAVADGIRTADLRGHASTTDFTNAVIARTRRALEGADSSLRSG
ncbi:MAG TPA: isocitrate/isopropylmalate family dehydrogenase [Chloroflexota bacterium]|nr:isocitrate/isopropylmalate family dehydrogenase [Chloroflexota bacterium]